MRGFEMTELTQQKCIPCESDIPPMKEEEIQKYLEEVPEWEVIKVEGVQRLI
jgi:4a-hydroxytetrahydrobiopterin dehydratase